MPGRVTASDAVAVPTAATVHGDELTISVNGGIQVAGAGVVSTDIEASNGLIHVIDRGAASRSRLIQTKGQCR